MKMHCCGSCAYKTSDKRDIKEHVKSHNEEQTFKCELCDYQTGTGDRLTIHVKSKHCREVEVKLEMLRETTTEKCSLCEYGCNSEDNLLNHMERYHDSELKIILGEAATNKRN